MGKRTRGHTSPLRMSACEFLTCAFRVRYLDVPPSIWHATAAPRPFRDSGASDAILHLHPDHLDIVQPDTSMAQTNPVETPHSYCPAGIVWSSRRTQCQILGTTLYRFCGAQDSSCGTTAAAIFF